MEQVNITFEQIEKTRATVHMLQVAKNVLTVFPLHIWIFNLRDFVSSPPFHLLRKTFAMYQESKIGKLMRKIATLEIEPDPYTIKSRCFALMQRYQRTLENYKRRHVAEFYYNTDTPVSTISDAPAYESEESNPFVILQNDIETDSDCGDEEVEGGGETYFIVYDASACEGNVNEDNDYYNDVKDESSNEALREEAVVVKQESDSVEIDNKGLIFGGDKIEIKEEDCLLNAKKEEGNNKATVTVKKKRNKKQSS